MSYTITTEDKLKIKKIEDILTKLESMTQNLENVTLAIMDSCSANDVQKLQQVLKEKGITNDTKNKK